MNNGKRPQQKKKSKYKKKGEKKNPKLSLGRRGVFLAGWLGDMRISSLGSSFLGLGSSLWALGLLQGLGLLTIAFVFWLRTTLASSLAFGTSTP